MPAGNQKTRAEVDTQSAQQALALLADRWTFLIIREAFRGVHRYGQLQRNLGIARNVLADRLSSLVEHGLFERVPYRTEPEWYEYRLTKSGLELYPAILAFFRWADAHSGDPDNPSVRIRHRDCGRPTRPLLVCSECRAPIGATDIELIE